jgi:hypothetical protein
VETTEHFLVVASFATQYCVAANAGMLTSATTEAATRTLRIMAFSQNCGWPGLPIPEAPMPQ